MSLSFAEAELQRAQRPRNLRPELPVPYPGTRPFGGLFGNNPLTHINDAQVRGLPAANRALNLIANGVASMAPLKALEGDGVSEILPTPYICARPNASWTAFDFWHTAVSTAIMRGNYVGLLADYDPLGYPRQVISVPPQLVWCQWGADGLLEYWFLGQRYRADDVVHVRAFATPDSPWGIGVVENFRRSLNGALEQQAMAQDTYSRGAVPTGVLTAPVPNPTPEQATEAKERWITAQGGSRTPAVVGNAWKFQPISWSPEDAQFLESRQFTVAEVALMFNLDPTDLGAAIGTTSITYQNVEQQEIGRLVDAYTPLMMRFEQAWSDLMPKDTTCRFVPENRLRVDAKTKAEVRQLNIASGIGSADEYRAEDGKKPLPKPAPVVPAPGTPGAPTPGTPAAATDESGRPFGPAPIPGTDIIVKPVSVKE